MDALKAILAQILGSNAKYQERKEEIAIYECWDAAVGPKVARNAWPIKLLSDGVLLVGSESSVWLQQLHYLEPQILSKLKQSLGAAKVKKLRFKLEIKQADSYTSVVANDPATPSAATSQDSDQPINRPKNPKGS